MERLVRAVVVAAGYQNAEGQDLCLREPVGQPAQERDRAALPHPTRRPIEGRRRSAVEGVGQPRGEGRRGPPVGRLLSHPRDPGAIGGIGGQCPSHGGLGRHCVTRRRDPDDQFQRGGRSQHGAGIGRRRQPVGADDGDRSEPGRPHGLLGPGGALQDESVDDRKGRLNVPGLVQGPGHPLGCLAGPGRRVDHQFGQEQVTRGRVLDPVQQVAGDPER